MSYLIRTSTLLLLVVFLGACQSNNQGSTNAESTTESEPTEEQTQEENKENSNPVDNVEVSLSQDKEDIPTELALNCLPSNNCSEDTVKRELRNVNLNEMTENVSVTPIKKSEEITVNIEGPQPAKISYIIESENNDVSSISDEVVDGNSFVVSGEGEYSVLLTAQWEDENGEFVGSVSKAAKLDVK